MKEHRKFNRLPIPMQIEYQVFHRHSLIKTFCMNISGGGLCFKSELCFNKGDKIKTYIYFRNDFDPVVFMSQVVWCKKEMLNRKAVFTVGVKYIKMDKKHRERFVFNFGEMMLNYFLPSGKAKKVKK